MPGQRTQEVGEPRDGLREARRRFTRQHIVDAAIAVFAERGYVASSVENIIERAGTSRRTFYAHFRSKADVLIEISSALLPEIEHNYTRLDEALAVGSREALRAWIMLIMDLGDRYGSLVPVWQQASTIEPELASQRDALIARYPELMPRYFARWPEEGAREEARLRIVLLSLQLDKLYSYLPSRGLGAAERGVVADVLTDIWHAGLQASPRGDPARAEA